MRWGARRGSRLMVDVQRVMQMMRVMLGSRQIGGGRSGWWRPGKRIGRVTQRNMWRMCDGKQARRKMKRWMWIYLNFGRLLTEHCGWGGGGWVAVSFDPRLSDEQAPTFRSHGRWKQCICWLDGSRNRSVAGYISGRYKCYKIMFKE